MYRRGSLQPVDAQPDAVHDVRQNDDDHVRVGRRQQHSDDAESQPPPVVPSDGRRGRRARDGQPAVGRVIVTCSS